MDPFLTALGNRLTYACFLQPYTSKTAEVQKPLTPAQPFLNSE
jgi:hypothetical protein